MMKKFSFSCSPFSFLDRKLSPVLGFFCTRLHLAEDAWTSAAPTVHFKSPLHKMTQTTPTCLWNDSASIEDLTYSIEHGAVGATCNPSIAVAVLKQELAVWKPRILELAAS